MYYLFRRHGWKPSDYWALPEGEKVVVEAMALLEAEQPGR